jgi:epoxyqueuosine reductase
LDDAAFRALYAGSPIKRIKRGRFVRNVLIAIGNSGDAGLLETVLLRLADKDPLVRGAAVWALGELDAARFAAEKAARLRVETNADVQAEWRAYDG